METQTLAARAAAAPWMIVALGGFVAGTIDITYASLFWFIKAGVRPPRIFQSVAAGWLGREAAVAGGMAHHVAIARLGEQRPLPERVGQRREAQGGEEALAVADHLIRVGLLRLEEPGEVVAGAAARHAHGATAPNLPQTSLARAPRF